MWPTLEVGGHGVALPWIVLLGCLVGWVAGLFGVGGGFLLTPLLTVVLGVPLPIAVGSGLCQMIGSSFVSVLRHRRLGQGEWRVDLLMGAGSLVGVHAGASALAALSGGAEVTLFAHRFALVNVAAQGAFIVLLVGTAALFVRQAGGGGGPASAPLARIALGPRIRLACTGTAVSGILLAELGFGVGFLSGFLGIGGGIVLMPALVYGLGFPIRQAAGTGILVLFASSIFGTVTHGLRGNVDLPLALTLLVGSSVSAQLGALASKRLDPRVMRRVFAGVLCLTALAVIWDLGRRATPVASAPTRTPRAALTAGAGTGP